ncbi:LysR family transcriptional regulator [Roseomonas sp. KE2513]|uniref:LysR substrate-binding domain-containing protein n=1 Tax=Roseomonas sp. KE2513 TaxID=2479202 RepID=UPI0018E003A7|nr:LysR substrate-binding domain-containing protein [Roseomonas sp. KE2513]MBI0539697.1 LysR family transcriptional regulator [Roseomonas sp. KE2513]
MDLHQLRLFLALAGTEHLGRAADALGIAPATLSHHLAALERSLGTTLFDRLGRGLRLTETGCLLRGFATRIVNEAEAARAAIAEQERSESGVLRLGVIHSFHANLMPGLVAEFLTAHPGVRIEAREMIASAIEVGLLDGELDLGLAFAPAGRPGLGLAPLFDEPLVLVTARGSRWTDAPPETIPLALLPPRFATRRLIDTSLQGRWTPHVVAEVDAIGSILALVRSGVVGTILSARSVVGDGLDCRAATDPPPIRRAALLWCPARYQSASARAFSDLVRARLARPEGAPSRRA